MYAIKFQDKIIPCGQFYIENFSGVNISVNISPSDDIKDVREINDIIL